MTIEELDEMRADTVVEQMDEGEAYRSLARTIARAIREADERAGLSTEALLAVMNGDAVIVPLVPTEEMTSAGQEIHPSGITDKLVCAFAAMVSVSPFVKKEGE